MKRVLLAAHRGYMAKYPENTILSYKKALELDIDQIEMDVRIGATSSSCVLVTVKAGAYIYEDWKPKLSWRTNIHFELSLSRTALYLQMFPDRSFAVIASTIQSPKSALQGS